MTNPTDHVLSVDDLKREIHNGRNPHELALHHFKGSEKDAAAFVRGLENKAIPGRPSNAFRLGQTVGGHEAPPKPKTRKARATKKRAKK